MILLVSHFVIYWVVSLLLMLDDGDVQLPSQNTLHSVLFNQLVVNTMVFWVFPIGSESVSWLTIPVAYLIEEIGFYWMHRLFHCKLLYPIHKAHHAWITTLPYVALDCHPLEHLLVNLFPLLLGPYLFSWNYAYIHLWLVAATFNTLSGHGKSMTNHHALHHRLQNVNYGISRSMDLFFGTCSSV